MAAGVAYAVQLLPMCTLVPGPCAFAAEDVAPGSEVGALVLKIFGSSRYGPNRLTPCFLAPTAIWA